MSAVKNYFKNLISKHVSRLQFRSNKELSRLYKVFQNSPESGWIIGKNDAIELYNLIHTHHPRNVLELGGGIGASTAVITLALKEGAKLTSMEQFEKCIKIAKNLIPENLKNKIKFVFSEAEAWKDDRISKYQYFSIYKNIPIEGQYDFVLVDGPDYWIENGQLINLPNGDLFKLIPHISPGGKIYVDGRKPAVGLYKRFLSQYLVPLKENFKYALFERNTKPLDKFENFEVLDSTLEKVKKTTYFTDSA